MASLNISTRSNNGFTLTEILISIGLLALIAALGMFISFDFYRNYSFRSERSVIVSTLQKARSQSMDNIDQVRHGVHFADPLQYIVFECKASMPACTDYSDADNSKDIVITPSFNSSVSGLPFDIIFDQLDGDLVSSTNSIAISDQGNVKNITINSAGRIDW
jgi:prepilin-type N-terminal cleavage/methylation domain-containing protein